MRFFFSLILSIAFLFYLPTLLFGTTSSSSIPEWGYNKRGTSLKNSDYYWEMEAGYGNDKNNDGRIDIPNTSEYFSTNRFNIVLGLTDSFLAKNHLSLNNADKFILSLEATANGKNYVALGKGRALLLKNVAVGSYQGTLTLRYQTKRYDIPITINPKKYTIVAMGDSYISGEGAPERIYHRGNYSLWADGGINSPALLNHARAHRSSKSWASQLALFLEQEDPHSSIIFIFVASSGAWTSSGILEPYGGTDDTLGGRLPGQIDELVDITKGGVIDYLFFTTGGNDLGFVPVITLGILLKDRKGSSKPSPSYIEKIDRVIQCSKDGLWKNAPFATLFGYKKAKPRLGLIGLTGALTKLDNQLKQRLHVKNIVFVGYPLPVNANEDTLLDLVKGFSISGYEANRVINEIMIPYDEFSRAISKKFGWHYISLLRAYDYSKHGYNGSIAYEPQDYNNYIESLELPLSYSRFRDIALNKEVAWFRKASDSVVIQGAAMDGRRAHKLNTKGTIHPNELGYQAIMHHVLQNIALPKDFPSDFQNEYKQ